MCSKASLSCWIWLLGAQSSLWLRILQSDQHMSALCVHNKSLFTLKFKMWVLWYIQPQMLCVVWKQIQAIIILFKSTGYQIVKLTTTEYLNPTTLNYSHSQDLYLNLCGLISPLENVRSFQSLIWTSLSRIMWLTEQNQTEAHS